MARFVRQSKFRHIFGKEYRKEQCYENITITHSSLEAKFSAANAKFIAVCLYSGGGGSFLVIPHDRVGRQDVNAPKVAGHTTDVLDVEWNPFDDHMIASSDEDGAIKVWQIPEGGLTTNLTSPLVTVTHQRKVTQISWHPVASNILLSVAQEPCVGIWNLETAEEVVEIEHPDQVYSAEWNENGSKIVSACKDKKFRVIDARSGEILQTLNGHHGGKPQRVIFLDDGKLFSTGFTKMSSRQYSIWDLKNPTVPLAEDEVDAANGTLIPYYDRDIKILYIIGRGDSTIRYYEITDVEPYCHWIANYTAKMPHRGVCMMSKRAVDVNRNEIARFYRLLSDKHLVEPVSFTVPRKSEQFQEDIFPPTPGDEPALTADEWRSGKNAQPILVSFADSFHGKVKTTKKAGGIGLGVKTGSKPAVKTADTKAAPVASASIDAGRAEGLKSEIKALQEKEKEMRGEITSLRSELAELKGLKEEVAAIKEAVKQNAQRVTTLESLVQEVSDDEGK